MWLNTYLRGVITSKRAHLGACSRAMRVYVPLTSVVLLAVAFPGVAKAETQGYNTTDKTITKGMAVSIADNQGTGANEVILVEKSSVLRADKTLGVVVDPSADLVAVSANGNQVYVANSGVAQVYVSNINGDPQKGDLLAPSPISGVLMKASEGTKGVIGAALDNFPTTGLQEVSVKDDNGQALNTKVGLIQVNMDVKFSGSDQASDKSLLQKIGEALVRRPVNSTQVIVAMIILSILLFVEGSIIYGAISSSIISLGRNPLAKRTILRGLGQISILVFVVLGIGLAAVYLVLWI